MTGTQFAEATAVAADPSNGALEGTQAFECNIAPGWDIMGNANGGYLMAMIGRAARESSGRPDIVSLSANFLAPGTPGPASIAVSPVRAGRRFSTQRCELVIAEAPSPALIATVVTGDLGDKAGSQRLLRTAPDMPDPSELDRVAPADLFPPPFVGRIDMRVHPDDAFGTKNGPRIRAWFRLLDGEPMDTLAVVLAGDSTPPPVFNTDLQVGWSPTVQLTVNVQRRPGGEWILIDSTSDVIDGSMFETESVLYDEDGTLIGRARQLQLLALG